MTTSASARSRVVERAPNQGQAPVPVVGRDAPALHHRIVGAAHDRQPAVERLAAGVEDGDRQAGVREADGDTAAHRARAHDGAGAHRPGLRFRRQSRNLARRSLRKEHVYQCPSTRRSPSLRWRAASRRRGPPRTAVARLRRPPRSPVSGARRFGYCCAARFRARSMTSARRGRRIHDALGGSARASSRCSERRGVVRSPPARRSPSTIASTNPSSTAVAASTGFARENQVERLLDADQSRHALRPAGSRDDTERDLGQPEARPGQCDPVMTGERDLEPASEHRAVHRGDDWKRQCPRAGGTAPGTPPPGADPRTRRYLHPRRTCLPEHISTTARSPGCDSSPSSAPLSWSRTALLSVLTGGLPTVRTAMPSAKSTVAVAAVIEAGLRGGSDALGELFEQTQELLATTRSQPPADTQLVCALQLGSALEHRVDRRPSVPAPSSADRPATRFAARGRAVRDRRSPRRSSFARCPAFRTPRIASLRDCCRSPPARRTDRDAARAPRELPRSPRIPRAARGAACIRRWRSASRRRGRACLVDRGRCERLSQRAIRLLTWSMNEAPCPDRHALLRRRGSCGRARTEIRP